MKVRHRPLFAWIALLGFLFSQVALSAYACPMLIGSEAPARMESMEPMGEMAGMPCAEHDTEQSLLCIQHCQQGQQTVGSSPSVHFPPAIVVLFIAPALTPAQELAENHVQAPFLARTTSPPPLWRSGRLRI